MKITLLSWANLAILVWALSAGISCKKHTDQDRRGTIKKQQNQTIHAPPEVIAYIGLKRPQYTVDNLLEIAKQFIPLPIDRNGILDILSQKTHLPREVLNTIAIDRPMWLVLLDKQQAGERDPGVFSLPLRARKEFEKALAQQLKKVGEEGDLSLYRLKSGEMGSFSLRLFITDQQVMIATSQKAFQFSRRFIQEQLIPRTPSYDVEAHFVVEHWMKQGGKILEEHLMKTLAKVKTRGLVEAEKSTGLAIPETSPQQGVTHYIDMLQSLREIIFTASPTVEQISISLRGEAKPGGSLHRLMQKQSVGEPFGYQLLPASSWLVFASLSTPETVQEVQHFWLPALRNVFHSNDAEEQQKFESIIASLRDGFKGDFTFSAHQPVSASGLSFSAVIRVVSKEKAELALEQVMDLVADRFRNHLGAGRGTKPKEPFKFSKQPWASKKTKGMIYTLSLPPAIADSGRTITKLLGQPFTGGWAISGEYALLTLGKNSIQQLEAMAQGIAGSKRSDSLQNNPAFHKAKTYSRGRIGWLYFSLLDFFRALDGVGIQNIDAIAAAIKDKRSNAAPSIDWGMSTDRSLFDITLHLPTEHFAVFKPFLEDIFMQNSQGSLLMGR